jgi:hypothetical protein
MQEHAPVNASQYPERIVKRHRSTVGYHGKVATVAGKLAMPDLGNALKDYALSTLAASAPWVTQRDFSGVIC